MDFDSILDAVISWATTTGLRLITGVIALFVSFKIIKVLARKIENSGARHSADKTVMRTVSYVFGVGARVLVILCLVSYIGLDTGGIAALIASLGVGVGLAVNGALSNLAGGVLIILTRPFRIDDFIEAQGFSGTVVDIHVTNTKLRTPDNKIIFIPNGALSSGSIVNYSLQSTRRVDVDFSVAYSTDISRAKSIVASVASNHPLVLKEPEIFVRVTEHLDSSIKLTLRAWVKSADYWTVRLDMLEQVKSRLDSEGIEIPFNKMDIYIKGDERG